MLGDFFTFEVVREIFDEFKVNIFESHFLFGWFSCYGVQSLSNVAENGDFSGENRVVCLEHLNV